MYRLIYPAILSFSLAFVAGCGGSDATDESPSPTTSSTGSTSKQATAPTTAPSYETPQAAFEALSKAAKSNDWKTATALLSPESQSMMAAGMMMGASFMTMGDEAKQKDLEQLLKNHGVNMDEEPSDEEEAGPEALTRSIKDLPAFVGEINDWINKNGDASDSGFPELGELGEVTVDGDAATATVDTEMGPQPIEFRRVAGSWVIHLPMDGPPPGADMPADLEPIEDDGTPGLGTLMIGDEGIKLRQATAYKSKSFDVPGTVVLLTAQPLNERQLGELKEMLKDQGNDDSFFPFVPHIKLSLDESGELMSLFAWADNLSISSGSSDVVLDIQQSENRISGTAQLPVPTEVLDTTYRFDATFDVELLSITDE